MKILITVFTIFLINVFAFAQAPEKMSYQAVIRNSNNALVAGSTVGMRISILQGSPSGQSVYVEQQTPFTNANGLASIEIGSGLVVSGSFVNINWANGPFFIKTETDPFGGTSYSISGTSQLLSVPYALYAKTAETVLGSGGMFSHFIGEVFGGGVVFNVYRDVNGFEHGLIVSLNDLGTAEWDLPPYVDVPISYDEWDGKANTAAIIASGALSNSAAGLCDAAIQGGQSDWYLPSIRELLLIHENIYAINRSLRATAGATEIQSSGIWPFNYWSSTSKSINFAFFLDFLLETPPQENVTLKDAPYLVRAIRTF